MDKNYSGSIALTKLKHVVRKSKKGAKIIVIPVEENYLVEGKDNAFYMPVRVITKAEEDQYGQHGFVSQSVDSKVYNAASEEEKEEFKKLPILGNIKDFSGGGNDSSGAADNEIEASDDDLPF